MGEVSGSVCIVKRGAVSDIYLKGRPTPSLNESEKKQP